jgi:hypothetical protein
MASYYRLIIFLIITFLSQNVFATKKKVTPDTVEVGAYVLSLHDINFHDKEYTLKYWLWFLYKNPDFDFTKQVEVPNAKENEQPETFVDTIDNRTWVLMKMKSKIKQSWNVQDYPFDEQFIQLGVENTMYDKRYLVFKPDLKNSTYAPNLNIDGWEIENFSISNNSNVYNTTFGDPRIKNKQSTEYDSFNINFTLKRDAWGLFLKIFIGMYFAFFISIISFLINIEDIEPRFGLPVGGLFAAVGNKYIIDSLLPESTSFTLVDTLHTLTFAYILLTIMSNAISLVFYNKHKVVKANKLNKRGSWLILGSYIAFNILFISIALFY